MDRYNSEKRIQELLDQNALLLMEIQNLKRILAENGIADNNDSDIGEKMVWDPDQGGRIKPEEITRQHSQLFFSRFWGREDVYSKRVVKKNGDVGYFTWHWGSGNADIDGNSFGFNIGYGFGNTSAASENVLFYNGKVRDGLCSGP